jgi:hypothetical protein
VREPLRAYSHECKIVEEEYEGRLAIPRDNAAGTDHSLVESEQHVLLHEESDTVSFAIALAREMSSIISRPISRLTLTAMTADNNTFTWSGPEGVLGCTDIRA